MIVDYVTNRCVTRTLGCWPAVMCLSAGTLMRVPCCDHDGAATTGTSGCTSTCSPSDLGLF